jgi:hypothetical protein
MNPNPFNRSKNIISSAANATITRDNSGSLLDNTGASGSVTLTLSDALYGDVFDIDVAAAHGMVIYAGATGVFVLAGSAGTAGQSLRNNGTAGDSAQIVCVGAGPTFRVRGAVGGSDWTVS